MDVKDAYIRKGSAAHARREGRWADAGTGDALPRAAGGKRRGRESGGCA